MDTLGNTNITTIYGYEGSTAQSYAKTYEYEFSLLGDVNGDNTITLKDVTELFQYVNRQIEGLTDGSAADLNGDGVVNLKDVMYLFQFVNGQRQTQ
jgi:hypothetical protein